MIYAIYKYLTDVPIDFWMWLMLIVPVMLVFAITPRQSVWLGCFRLVLAIGLFHILGLLSMETRSTIAWNNYRTCHSQLSDGSIQRYEECKPLLAGAAGPGARAFAIVFGFVYGIGYVGFWELLWRVWHRKTIRALGKNYKGKWFSNIIIALSALVFIFLISSILSSVFFR